MINETDTTEVNPFDEIDLDVIDSCACTRGDRDREPEDDDGKPNPFDEIDANSDGEPFW